SPLQGAREGRKEKTRGQRNQRMNIAIFLTTQASLQSAISCAKGICSYVVK
ncbi:hypothetical protein M9458_050475, partial [Cirrhinus mrigala]